ncbi:MAG: AraC family transcriptional regulator [Clostridia bacterium]|nr:AraC family transcriptional regulator [Clostridia bacterium]
MRYVRLISCPRIEFAHTYHADTYRNRLVGQRSIMEVTYVEKGQLTFTDGEGTFCAHAGDVICNLYKGELAVSAESFHEHLTVCFSLDFDVIRTDGSGGDVPGLLLPLIVSPPDSRTQEVFRDCISGIIRLHTLSPGSPDGQAECAGLFLRLLSAVSAAARAAGDADRVGGSLYVKRAMDYLYTHLDRPIRQQEVARSLGITPEYLCALFRQEAGVPMMTCVNRMKLERIRTVMRQEGLPLSQAAELYGFSDPNYVSRLYRKLFGMSITEAVKGDAR